jgi:hypothetical protein
MGEVIQMPRRVRAEHVACGLQNAVVETLCAIQASAGNEAFDRAALRIMTATASVLAHVCGREHVINLFDLIENNVLPDSR